MNGRQRAGHPTRVQVRGSLAPYAGGFRQDLAGKGYHPQVIGRQVGLMAGLSRWLGHLWCQVFDVSPECDGG